MNRTRIKHWFTHTFSHLSTLALPPHNHGLDALTLARHDTARRDRYNLTGGDPDYFTKAVNEPDDYIGQRILNDSPNREAS